MLKRFIIGFVLAVGGMYWYIHYESTFSDASQWMERSASQYRGDRDHRLVEEATGGSRR